jgi:predicted nucleic-acid-binding Zn-ribbon protein
MAGYRFSLPLNDRGAFETARPCPSRGRLLRKDFNPSAGTAGTCLSILDYLPGTVMILFKARVTGRMLPLLNECRRASSLFNTGRDALREIAMKKKFSCPACGNRELTNLYITTTTGKSISLLLSSQAEIRKSSGEVNCIVCNKVSTIKDVQIDKQSLKLTS